MARYRFDTAKQRVWQGFRGFGPSIFGDKIDQKSIKNCKQVGIVIFIQFLVDVDSILASFGNQKAVKIDHETKTKIIGPAGTTRPALLQPFGAPKGRDHFWRGRDDFWRGHDAEEIAAQSPPGAAISKDCNYCN